MKYNRRQLRVDIKEVTNCIKDLKRRQRESRQPHWDNSWDNWALIKQKRLATRLCSFAAHMRGKLHICSSTVELQFALIKDLIPKYQLEEQQTVIIQGKEVVS